jgi:hypothetical protein
MAEAILKYDLNDSDDTMAHMRAVKSLDMALALWEIKYNTKKSIAYALEGKDYKGESISNYDVLDMVYEWIHEILDEHNKSNISNITFPEPLYGAHDDPTDIPKLR